MKALAAEMTASFGSRLSPLGLSVRELTGDMQMTKREIQETQVCSSIETTHLMICFTFDC